MCYGCRRRAERGRTVGNSTRRSRQGDRRRVQARPQLRRATLAERGPATARHSSSCCARCYVLCCCAAQRARHRLRGLRSRRRACRRPAPRSRMPSAYATVRLRRRRPTCRRLPSACNTLSRPCALPLPWCVPQLRCCAFGLPMSSTCRCLELSRGLCATVWSAIPHSA